MTTATWPADVCFVPQPGSLTETPMPSKATYQPEVGPSKDRNRSTALCFQFDWSIVLNRESRAALLDFYRDELKNGTLRFSHAHPIDDTPAEWKFAQEPQIQMVSRKRFIAKLSLTLLP